MSTAQDLGLALASDWSLWIGWVGRGLLWLALGLYLTAALMWIRSPGRPRAERFGARAFTFGSVAIFGAMGALTTLFVTDQFQFAYVFAHSDKAASPLYKISSVWAGQEGSILLWATCVAGFGLLAARRTGELRRWFTVAYAAILAGLTGILVFESPFKVDLFEGRPWLPPDGAGLNPVLQNYWIVIHPPTIFLGFGSLTVAFAWAFAALAKGDLSGWVQPVRPWVILCATLLGLGLCMGGFWAYETLGWGGFWAWDPVENTSFVPWVLSIALFHGLVVQRARNKWAYGNAALAGLGLISFYYGTFLTRSGFLGDASVHSFAEMDRTALWLLIGLGGLSTLGFFALWAVRLRQALRQPREVDMLPYEGLRRDQAMGAGMWLLVVMGLAAGIGMSVPMLMSISGQAPKVVEEGLYHLVFAWLFPPTLLVMTLGPWLTWRGVRARELLTRLVHIVSLTMFFLGLAMIALHFVPEVYKPDPDATINMPGGTVWPLVPWMMGLIGLLIFGTITSLWKAIESGKHNGWAMGGFLTHFGVILAVAGLIVSRGFERKERVFVQEGMPVAALGYTVQFDGMSKDLLTKGNQVAFRVDGQGRSDTARPGLYYIPREGRDPQAVATPHVFNRWWYDFYVAVHPMVFDASEAITLKPGESAQIPGATLRYKDLIREGEPGSAGTIFRADLVMESNEGQISTRPGLRVRGEAGMQVVPSPAGEGLQTMLLNIDAATRAVTVQVQFSRPLFPLELYYKPMTLLIWLGVGIMTVGGLMSALHRRRGLRQGEAPTERPTPTPEDAPKPVAQV